MPVLLLTLLRAHCARGHKKSIPVLLDFEKKRAEELLSHRPHRTYQQRVADVKASATGASNESSHTPSFRIASTVKCGGTLRKQYFFFAGGKRFYSSKTLFHPDLQTQPETFSETCDERALPLVGSRSESVWKRGSRGGVAGGWNAACQRS